MYELFYNTLEFLINKTEPINQTYVKYVPKLLRFILPVNHSFLTIFVV